MAVRATGRICNRICNYGIETAKTKFKLVSFMPESDKWFIPRHLVDDRLKLIETKMVSNKAQLNVPQDALWRDLQAQEQKCDPNKVLDAQMDLVGFTALFGTCCFSGVSMTVNALLFAASCHYGYQYGNHILQKKDYDKKLEAFDAEVAKIIAGLK